MPEPVDASIEEEYFPLTKEDLQVRRNVEPWLRRMRKKDFIERFGGSHRVFLEWGRSRGLPWHADGDVVNAVAAIVWLREQVAAQLETEDTEAVQRSREVHMSLADLKLAKAELQHQVSAGELVPLEELTEMIDGLAAAIRGGIERLAPYGDEVQRVMVEVIDEFERGLADGGVGVAEAR